MFDCCERKPVIGGATSWSLWGSYFEMCSTLCMCVWEGVSCPHCSTGETLRKSKKIAQCYTNLFVLFYYRINQCVSLFFITTTALIITVTKFKITWSCTRWKEFGVKWSLSVNQRLLTSGTDQAWGSPFLLLAFICSAQHSIMWIRFYPDTALKLSPGLEHFFGAPGRLQSVTSAETAFIWPHKAPSCLHHQL